MDFFFFFVDDPTPDMFTDESYLKLETATKPQVPLAQKNDDIIMVWFYLTI